jgi:hypothetical protein
MVKYRKTTANITSATLNFHAFLVVNTFLGGVLDLVTLTALSITTGAGFIGDGFI